MSYKALYRTYRPQVFSDVTGQDVVVQTLQNAIKNNKISHAYLFSGPRGTGKTSIARIFAKALNCSNLQVNEPCDECLSCREISEGYNPDVIEIDAASNNGVDEIRDIREKVKFLPSGSKYKVYIIDEVHMLSGGAFNALLKTLEEPPKHAVFILATTEPQKLPATIISRCQRFEFKALSTQEINERLKQICELENVSITEEALNSISESAEGAMRDAISILDQAISYGNKEIGIDDINGVTGSLSFEKVIELGNAIENKDVHKAVEIFNELISSGKEVSKIINSLLVFYRDVLLYKSIGDSGLSKFIFSKELFQEFCGNITISKIMYFIDVLCDVQSKVKYSTTPNIFLEIALIKMCNITVEELDVMKRLSELEDKFNNIGNISGPQGDANVVVDNEKVNTIELRVNQIISELNRLEIRKQIEKIGELKEIVSNLSNSASGEDIREIKNELHSLSDKVSELDLFVNKEEVVSSGEQSDELIEKVNALEEKVNNFKAPQPQVITTSHSDVDLSDVYSRIKELENKESQSFDNQDILVRVEELEENVSSILEDINTLKEMISNRENKDYEAREVDMDLSEISDKLMFLEKRMYQVIAGELSTSKVTKKETNKNKGQIMLFGEEVLSVNDFEPTKQNYDFGDLQKPEEEIEATREEVVEKPMAPMEEEMPIVVEDEVVLIAEEEKVEEFEEEIIPQFAEEDIEETEVDMVIEEQPETEEPETLVKEEQENDEVDEDILIQQEQPQNTDVDQENLFGSEVTIFAKPKEEEKKDTVVSHYFDVDKGQEIIHKEKSTLVVAERKPVEPTSSLEQDIIALERENTYNKSKEIAPKEEVKEIVDVKVEPEVKRDKFASYNIKDIEQILHDSRAPEARNDKVRIEQVWKNMTRGARPEHLSIIETLQEGKIAVVGNKEFIIAFPNVALCNIVMRRKFKDIAIRILYNLLGDTYDYVALPNDTWSSKSIEYKQQYQIGIKYPTLKPLEVEGLEIKSEQEYQTNTDRVINKTLKLFGEGNVDIE